MKMISLWRQRSMKLQTATQIRIALIAGALMLISGGGQAADSVRVIDLTQSGWQIIEKTSRNIKKPGLPPYENATRLIAVTTYKLAKGEQRYTCTIAYDSQLDQFEESCAAEK